MAGSDALPNTREFDPVSIAIAVGAVATLLGCLFFALLCTVFGVGESSEPSSWAAAGEELVGLGTSDDTRPPPARQATTTRRSRVRTAAITSNPAQHTLYPLLHHCAPSALAQTRCLARTCLAATRRHRPRLSSASPRRQRQT